jgi:sugar phosphate isomerase/epimerase
MRPEALTSPLPRELGIKVVGPLANRRGALDVFNSLVPRASKLGVKILVIGCGYARFVDKGFPVESAYNQFLVFLSEVAEICEVNNITVAVETLNQNETNLLNSTQETRNLIRAINHPAIQMLIDCDQVFVEGLSIETELRYTQGHLVHAHTSDPGRTVPGSFPSIQLVFLQGLLNMGYNHRISVECNFKDFKTESMFAIQFLRTYFSGVTDIS